MEDFYSKDLDRTFEKVVFLDALLPEGATSPHAQELTPGSKTIIEKSDVSIDKVEGMVSISAIYAESGGLRGKNNSAQG